MKNATITAGLMLSSLLMGAMARPMHHHKRAVDVITVTQEVVEVEYITSTIYIDEPLSTSVSAHAIVVVPTSQAPAVVIPSSTPVPTTTPVAMPAAVAVTPVPTPKSVTPAAAAVVTAASTTPVQVFVAPVPTIMPTPAPVAPTLAPTPTPTLAPEPATSAAPVVVPAAAPSTPASSGSSSAGTFSGDGTFYTTGLGSCGITSQDTDMIAALSFKTMDLTNPGNPNHNPMCGRKVRAFSATNTEGIIVSIVDTCAGCAGAHDLDFSPTAFDLLGLETVGRIPITWEYI